MWNSFTKPAKKNRPVVDYSLGNQSIIYRGEINEFVCETEIYFIWGNQQYREAVFYKEDNIPIGTASSYAYFKLIPDTYKAK